MIANPILVIKLLSSSSIIVFTSSVIVNLNKYYIGLTGISNIVYS